MITCPREDGTRRSDRGGWPLAVGAALLLVTGCGLEPEPFTSDLGDAVEDRVSRMAEGEEADAGDLLLALLATADLSDWIGSVPMGGEPHRTSEAKVPSAVERLPLAESGNRVDSRTFLLSSSPDPAPEVEPDASADEGAAACLPWEIYFLGECLSAEAFAAWLAARASPDPAPESPPSDGD